MKTKVLATITIAAACALQACEHSHPQPIQPVYEYIATLSDSPRAEVPAQMVPCLDLFEQVVRVDDQEALVHFAQSDVVKVFTPDVREAFPTLETLEEQLGYILSRAQADSLELPTRDYGAVVWGKHHSILVADSVMLIALNHYLGEDYPGYSHIPAYMRSVKTPEMLPYDLAEALVGLKYPYKSQRVTPLSAMLYNGVLAYAKTKLVKNADEAMAMGYDQAQMAWLSENRKNLWNTILARNLLFEPSENIARKLCDPAPRTEIINSDAPGRVGRYIGYQLVKEYVKQNPNTPLRRLLSPEFYADPDVLQRINFRP